MSLDDLIQAWLAGRDPEVPPELRAEYARRVAELPTRGGGPPLAAPPVARRPPLPDDYEVLRELGRGGMGVVHLARQRSLDRLVAVKLLSPGGAEREHVLRRFAEEARHLAKLRHPNIVAVHETGLAGEVPYFTMDYVEGESLSARIRRCPLTPSESIGILAQVCEAVSHAHRQGIVHRDLKPANVLLGPAGRAFVTDFGLARDLSRESGLTASGDVLGTPSYMAPEQANGEAARIGERSDVYSLGAILYEMLAGCPPFGGGTAAQVIARVLTQDPIPPRSLEPSIPRDLETVCLKAMAREPEGRYATVDALLDDLRRFQAGEAVRARRPGLLERGWRVARRHRILLAALAAAAAVVAVAGPLLFDRSLDELVRTAEEQHESHNHVGAVEIYVKAIGKARPSRVAELYDAAVVCATELGDTPEGVAAWFLLANADQEWVPNRQDLSIARTLCRQADLPARMLMNHYIGDDPRNRWQMARRRLKIYLEGPYGTPAERSEAQALLQKVTADLANPPKKPSPADLPEGSAAKLEARAGDETLDAWERGKAAHAAGLLHEREGTLDAALDDFRKAWGLVRPVYPTYARPGHPYYAPEPPECDLVRRMVLAIRRLDPSSPDPLRGGIRFRIEGVTLPEDGRLLFEIDLNEATARPLAGEEGCRPSPGLTIGHEGTVLLGVADGTYRLSVTESGNSGSHPSTWAFLGRVLLDLSALPSEVTVDGQEVDLPPIRARLLEEVRILEPEDGAAVDPRTAWIRWTPIPGAVEYRVRVSVLTPTADPYKYAAVEHRVTTRAAELCLGPSGELNLPAEFRAQVVPGKRLECKIWAIDASGRDIGVNPLSSVKLVVMRGLDDK